MIFQQTISDKIVNLCKQHANYYGTSLIERYVRRGQHDSEKIIQDMIVGKIGEVGTYLYFVKTYGVDAISVKPYLLKEDLSNVKDHNDFSHDADIVVNNMNIHIKTQNREQTKRFGSTWVFQRSHVEELQRHDTTNEHVAFCEVDLKTNLYQLKIFQSLDYLLENNMFKDMTISKYNHGPKAKFSVYHKDFLKLAHS